MVDAGSEPGASAAAPSAGAPATGATSDGASSVPGSAATGSVGSTKGPPSFAATAAPLAAVHDVALLDLDGVVYVGPEAVPHAAESLDRALADHGMRSAFVTNNASRPPSVVAEHLRALGIHAGDADVVTSAQAGARVLAERLPAGAAVLAIGGPGVARALEERRLRPVRSADDHPAAVLQGYGPDVSWRDLAEGCLAISRGGLFVATNLDRTIPTPRGRVLGNGAMVAALRHGTGVEPLVAGKPEPPLMLESVERTGARRPLVVGDRLDTDIEGATRLGIPSLLVLTGVTSWQDLLDAPPRFRPTYLGWDLRALLEPAPGVEVRVSADTVEARCAGVSARAPIRRRTGAAAEASAGSGWLPARWRAIGPLDPSGIEAVRTLIAITWAAADRGLRMVGEATVRSQA